MEPGAAEWRAARFQESRAKTIEALRYWEERCRQNAGPRTWETYLPEHLRHHVGDDPDPAAPLREMLARPEPPPRLTGLPEDLSLWRGAALFGGGC